MKGVYAISPGALRSDSPFDLLVGEMFGFQSGRFIALLPSGWVHLALKNISDMPDGSRKQARRRLLAKWQEERAVVGTFPYVANRSWADNSRNPTIGLKRVLLDKPIGEIPPDGSRMEAVVDDLVEDPQAREQFFSEKASVLYEETEQGLRTRIAPLMKVSEEVYVIDRYLDFWEPTKRDAIHVILSMLKQGRHSRLVVYTDYDRLLNNWPDGGKIRSDSLDIDKQRLMERAGERLRIEFSKHKGRHLCFRYLRWERILHARTIFSKYGGINVDPGLSVKRSSKQVEGLWLNQELLDQKLLDLSDAYTKHVPEIEINVEL